MLVLGDNTVIDYPIMDADAHVNEPPDLWQTRVPAKFRERAPKVVNFDKGGDAWSFDNGKRISPVGITATAGLSYLQFNIHGYTYNDIRPGSFDPKARVGDMDIDGIACAVLYPSVTLGGARSYGDDPELQLACVKAYNDWLAEFCSYNPRRLYGLSVIPTSGIKDAVAELKRGIDLGMRGALLSTYPNGTSLHMDEDAEFWDICQNADFPVQIHIGGNFGSTKIESNMEGRRAMLVVAGATKSGSRIFPVVSEFLFNGIFEEFEDLKVVMVEGNIGWIPTLLEQTDDMFLRYRFWNGGDDMKMLPSEYFYRNIYSTFMIDTVGVGLRHKCGIDHIMWSTDYPHTGTDWPNSVVTLQRNFHSVPTDEVKKMIHENAVKLYKLDPDPKAPSHGQV